MTAQVIPFSSRRDRRSATNPRPALTEARQDPHGPGETFSVTTFIDKATGRRAFLTEHGKAWRINGHWHVARDGRRPTYVSNPEYRAFLDAAERALRP